MNQQLSAIKTAIIGAQGYVGRELARLLLRHPQATLAGVFSRQEDWNLGHDLPEIKKGSIAHYAFADLETKIPLFDYFFLATPPEVSMELAPQLLAQGKTVIDLSGAFRVSAADFQQWYQQTHTAAEFIEQAVYGLAPWWQQNNSHLSNINLIANPGCYATCALMALLPLLKSNVIKPENIIIDAKSGATGAGRKANQDLLFCEIADNFFPYKIGCHQHVPEIVRCVQFYTDCKIAPTFVTQLLPLKRGIAMSIYCDIREDLVELEAIEQAVAAAYQAAYADYPLIKIGAINGTGQSKADIMSLVALNQVTGSARTHIGYAIQPSQPAQQRKLLIFASIDNLLKGAASQAIENFNALLKLPLATGLAVEENLL